MGANSTLTPFQARVKDCHNSVASQLLGYLVVITPIAESKPMKSLTNLTVILATSLLCVAVAPSFAGQAGAERLQLAQSKDAAKAAREEAKAQRELAKDERKRAQEIAKEERKHAQETAKEERKYAGEERKRAQELDKEERSLSKENRKQLGDHDSDSEDNEFGQKITDLTNTERDAREAAMDASEGKNATGREAREAAQQDKKSRPWWKIWGE
jgi:hypothetical protein